VFGASVRNYHIALRAALNEFITLQKNPPMIRLRIGNEFQMVRARLFWVNTIADGLANEQLVGRIQNRTTSPRLSRGCHCPQHLADCSLIDCQFLRQASIERLVMAALGPLSTNNGWNDYLKSLVNDHEVRAAEATLEMRKKLACSILKNVFGQHVVDLAWFHVDQGPNPRGCFGSTSVDPMHAFEEGIVPNILSVILDPLSDTEKSKLDAIALNIVSCNRWDPEYPRMNFSGGFSSLTQLTADEKMGKLLLLQTPLGRMILDKRCAPTFDDQKTAIAMRFSSCKENEHDSENDGESEDGSSSTYQKFTGSPDQITYVNNCLCEHGLHFILPWIHQMIPFHQDILRRTVFHVNRVKGKGRYHALPDEMFLDRREVNVDISDLYCNDKIQPFHRKDLQAEQSAHHSIDCSVDQLQMLLEMLLSFHAAYKYGSSRDEADFEKNVKLMMKYIKNWVRRGNET